MKTLYITDLDGTLLNNNAVLSPESINTLNVLIGRGLNFTYATARSRASALKVMRGVNLTLPVVTSNGAFIVNHNSGKIIHGFTMDAEKSAFLPDTMERLGLYALVNSIVDGVPRVLWVKGAENRGIRDYFADREPDKRFLPVSSRKELNKGNIYGINFTGSQRELMPMYDVLRETKGFSMYFYEDVYNEHYWLEIYEEQVSKGAGLQWFREYYSFDKIICFGDNLNDVSMFNVADKAFAVRNAHDQLKLLADGIIGSNEENGVTEFILQDFGNR